MINLGWDVYRWTVRQMQKQLDTVKDELRVFLGNQSKFRGIDDCLPTQRRQALNGDKLELREYQQEVLDNLQSMRDKKETIALLYQATGTGKTVTIEFWKNKFEQNKQRDEMQYKILKESSYEVVVI